MTEMEMLRADVLLARRGLAPSRERAQALIEAGLVKCNGSAIRKASQKLCPTDAIEVIGEVCPYVSRGGFKLARAIECFHVSPAGRICVDIGASTGGFTDVLLQNGAERVYAVDVGTAQLDARLKNDPRVVSMEKVNARTLKRNDFPIAPTFGAMDVSFISILKILPALRDVLGDDGRLIALVKPQFEAGRAAIGKNGIVSRRDVHERVLRDIQSNAPLCGWRVRAYDYSPIRGGDGNLEFLADFVPDAESIVDAVDIRSVVDAAHRSFKNR